MSLSKNSKVSKEWEEEFKSIVTEAFKMPEGLRLEQSMRHYNMIVEHIPDERKEEFTGYAKSVCYDVLKMHVIEYAMEQQVSENHIKYLCDIVYPGDMAITLINILLCKTRDPKPEWFYQI